jgi:hypothetical protein
MTDTTQDEGAPVADDLADLRSGADELDGAGHAAMQARAQAEEAQAMEGVADTSMQIMDALTMARMVAEADVLPWMPEYLQVWNDQRLKQIADNAAILMHKYGMTFWQFLAKWGPVFGLLAAALPAAFQTVMAYKRRNTMVVQA